jgi:hypothetical protein
MNKKWFLVGVSIGGLLVGIFGIAGMSLAQAPLPTEMSPAGESSTAGVAGSIPIQGRLIGSSGTPLNGVYEVTFRLYGQESGGTSLCGDTNYVVVSNGLFNETINFCTSSIINGRQLYLGIQVGSDAEMTPRQPIYPVPYAWSLRSGAIISDTNASSYILHLENWGVGGRGLRSYAMDSSSKNYGIVGASRSPAGYGGYFYNSGGGTALYAQSIDAGNDLVLGGNSGSGAGDDGRLSSDPDYSSSDLVLVSNDNIRLDLDDDADESDSDFEIYNKDDNLVFNVDESGDVTYGGAGIAAFPRPAWDSGWTSLDAGHTALITHSNLGWNVDNYVVDLTCKNVTDGVNNWGTGGDWNWEEFYGVYWFDLSTTEISVKRMDDDVSCPLFRIRIWIYP